jgi:general secretion pathway protein E
MKTPQASPVPTISAPPTGVLDWRVLLQWLKHDKVISAGDADQTERRFAGGHSAQHALVRLGGAGLKRLATGKPLDVERLTEWLAGRCKLPYLRIDPLKVDVGRVAEVMSINYAERRHALPIQVGLHEVSIATCEPFDIGWVAEIESHTRKTVRLLLASPQEIARYTTEFYTLSRSVRAAAKSG